jgi:hypothetical protein
MAIRGHRQEIGAIAKASGIHIDDWGDLLPGSAAVERFSTQD